MTLPGVRLTWPAGFHELPVGGDAAERRRHLDELLTALFPADPSFDEVRAVARDQYTAVGSLQRSQGILAAAVCNGRIGDRVTGAYVSLALTPLAYDSVDVAALGIERLATGHVEVVRLPAGPAVATTDVRTITAGAALEAGVLQVMVPAPGHQALLTITLMTPCLPDFTAYCEDGAALARSVRFVDPPAPVGLIGTTALVAT